MNIETDLARDHRRPRGLDWVEVGPFVDPGLRMITGAIYERGSYRAISTLVNAEYPTGEGVGPQFHISFSRTDTATGRLCRREVRQVLRDFGLLGAEEDNHHPGRAHHFWRPVDPAHRVACQCKATEDTIREPGGYRWTNPTPESGEGCRGCEYALMSGQPCPIHHRAAPRSAP